MNNKAIENTYFIIDFDSTFVTVETLDELARIALANNPQKEELVKEIATITRQGMDGKIDFPTSLAKRLVLFQPTHKDIDQLVMFLKEHISPSILRNKEFFQKNADHIYILSGGFAEYIWPIVEEFGFTKDHILANEFIFDQAGKVTSFNKTNPLAQKKGKVKAIKALHLSGNVIVLGDGYTDYEIKKEGAAKKLYAFVENVTRSQVTSLADEVVFNFDELLYMLSVPSLTSFPKSRINVLMLATENPTAEGFFEQEGYNITKITKRLSSTQLQKKLTDTTILITDSRTELTESILSAGKKLLAIGRFGLGTGNIDLDYCTNNGILVFNAPFSNIRSVAELAIGEMILLLRQTVVKNTELQAGIWDKKISFSHELRGKKLGILGYDSVGSQVSVLAELMGLHVYFYDPEERLPLGNAHKCESIEELLRVVDIVSIHGDPKSIQIGEYELNLLKKGTILINLSRGVTIDEKILATFLKNGTLAGVASDVFAKEPKTNPGKFTSLLQKFPNVILTPHIGGTTEEALIHSGEYVTDKIITYINTGSIISSVNFPDIKLPDHPDSHRFIHIHKNIPGMLAQINAVCAEKKVNIQSQFLKTTQEVGYVILDVAHEHDKELVAAFKAIPGTIRVRELY